jgi:hypothetical protein
VTPAGVVSALEHLGDRLGVTTRHLAPWLEVWAPTWRGRVRVSVTADGSRLSVRAAAPGTADERARLVAVCAANAERGPAYEWAAAGLADAFAEGGAVDVELETVPGAATAGVSHHIPYGRRIGDLATELVYSGAADIAAASQLRHVGEVVGWRDPSQLSDRARPPALRTVTTWFSETTQRDHDALISGGMAAATLFEVPARHRDRASRLARILRVAERVSAGLVVTSDVLFPLVQLAYEDLPAATAGWVMDEISAGAASKVAEVAAAIGARRASRVEIGVGAQLRGRAYVDVMVGTAPT